MQISWQISEDDKARVIALISRYADNPFVRARKAANLATSKPVIDREIFWRRMVGMRLTSIQRSGPDSYVARFLRTTPFLLSYETVRDSNDRTSFISLILKQAGGIRFSDKIASDLNQNLTLLDGGGMKMILKGLTQPRFVWDQDQGVKV